MTSGRRGDDHPLVLFRRAAAQRGQLIDGKREILYRCDGGPETRVG
jgi:hypothetical protein